MSEFYSRNNRPRTITCPVGDGVNSDFVEKIENGYPSSVKVGESSCNDLVQASLQETLIYNILQRYGQGDVSALDKVQGFYIDATNMPSSLAEAQQRIIDISKKFDDLPLDVKAKFDNSVDVFIDKVSHMTIDEFDDHFLIKDNIKDNINDSTLTKDGEIDE